MNPQPRAPFDQGLFLAHFNKGKELYEQGKYEPAERELEEAYLLRPRDQKVLNLLGLVYFKQDKLEKAEEVYRKLVTESPDAHTLFYNLGLIYFKLNRFEEAESAFLKALDLSEENPKINFYLGSIYERLHRFQDAIFQYRQAGANIMVRRVEDKIAAGGPLAAGPAPPPPPRPPAPAARSDDTAEFKASEVRESIRQHAEGLRPAKTLRPVSDALMAAASFDGPRTIPFQPSETLPPAGAPLPPQAIPRQGRQLFRFLENNLLEVNFSGKVFIKQGTIYSYGGNLTFWVKEKRPEGEPALVIVTGSGRIILTDRDRQITLMQVEGEALYVEPSHLLACEETLTPRYQALGAERRAEFLVLEGQGLVALSAASRPLSLAVTPDLPVSVPAPAVVSWKGSLQATVVVDPQVYEVMLSSRQAGSLIRLEGTGQVLVEQALV